MRVWLAGLLALAAGPAAGQTVEHETLEVLGFNAACSVAVTHYAYPVLGEAIYGEPIRAQVGTLTIPPGEQKARESWLVDSDGELTWNADEAKKAVADLRAAGYDKPAYPETVRPAAPGDPPGLDLTLFSTATFALRTTAGWPGPDWRWTRVLYSPVGECGLFLFVRADSPQPFYRTLLLRTYNPAARLQRSRAHLANSRILLQYSDLAGAVEESRIAAAMAPLEAPARYRNAAMLCLNGESVEALEELAAAVALDPRTKARAREDEDFDTVRKSPRFKSITRGR